MQIKITNLLNTCIRVTSNLSIPAASQITVTVTDALYQLLQTQYVDKRYVKVAKIEEAVIQKEAIAVVAVKEVVKPTINLADKSIPDLKALVMKGTITAKEVLAFETANKNRNAFIQWLNQFDA